MLADRAVEMLTKTYVDPSTRDLCYNAFYANETVPSEVISVAETLPFLTERRVILVRNAEVYEYYDKQDEDENERLLAYLANPCETTLLMLIANNVDLRSRFYKACKTLGEIVECPELEERAVKTWIAKEVQSMDRGIDRDAINEIFDRAGTQLSDVSNALRVVTYYLGEAKQITREDVVASCADVAEETVWALTDAIAESDATKALRVLRELIDMGKNEFEILGTLNWLLKVAYLAATGRGRVKAGKYQLDKIRPLAAKLGEARLRDAFALCMETDILYRTTGVSRSLALELLVVKLTARDKQAIADSRLV